jgi:hypothetical protein
LAIRTWREQALAPDSVHAGAIPVTAENTVLPTIDAPDSA